MTLRDVSPCAPDILPRAALSTDLASGRTLRSAGIVCLRVGEVRAAVARVEARRTIREVQGDSSDARGSRARSRAGDGGSEAEGSGGAQALGGTSSRRGTAGRRAPVSEGENEE